MNLLELMLKEEVEWPVGAEYAAQDRDDHTVHFYRYEPRLLLGTEWSINEYEGVWRGRPKHKLAVTALDWPSRIITREEYQAAAGKLAVPSDDVEPPAKQKSVDATLTER